MNAVTAFAPRGVELSDFICLHIFVALNEIQIRPGTVIGLKNNLPSFASA